MESFLPAMLKGIVHDRIACAHPRQPTSRRVCESVMPSDCTGRVGRSSPRSAGDRAPCRETATCRETMNEAGGQNSRLQRKGGFSSWDRKRVLGMTLTTANAIENDNARRCLAQFVGRVNGSRTGCAGKARRGSRADRSRHGFGPAITLMARDQGHCQYSQIGCGSALIDESCCLVIALTHAGRTSTGSGTSTRCRNVREECFNGGQSVPSKFLSKKPDLPIVSPCQKTATCNNSRHEPAWWRAFQDRPLSGLGNFENRTA